MDLMVCVGSSCHLQNSHDIIKQFKALIQYYHLEDQVELKGSFCMGQCAEKGVCVKYEDKIYGVTPDMASHFFEKYVVKKP